jgi:NAD(P)H-dependent flavin oxidoreductase YrpB (nitropropane dioxygenase family)
LEAFFRIADPQNQAAVVALAEKYAVNSPDFTGTLARMLRKYWVRKRAQGGRAAFLLGEAVAFAIPDS